MGVVNKSIDELLEKGCGCKLNCITTFTIADVERIRDSFLALTSEEKDIFFMGLFIVSFKANTGGTIVFQLEGKKLCRK